MRGNEGERGEEEGGRGRREEGVMITWLGLFVLVRGKGWDRCLSETRYKRLISERGCCCSGGGGREERRREIGGEEGQEERR